MEELTVQSILKEREKRKKLEEELQSLTKEAEREDIGKEEFKNIVDRYSLTTKISAEKDLELNFKDYGHPFFIFPPQFEPDTVLNEFIGNEKYFFQTMLKNRFWDEMKKYFKDRPFQIAEIVFKLMTASLEHCSFCQQYLLSDSNSWMPSYNLILESFSRFGASRKILDLNENITEDCEMKSQDLNESGSEISKNDELITIIRTTLEYLLRILPKLKLNQEEKIKLVLLFLKMSLDKSCVQLLPLITSLVDTLLYNLSPYNEDTINQLANSLLEFDVKIPNKIFISLNVLSKRTYAQKLALYFSLLLFQDLLGVEKKGKQLKNLQPLLFILETNIDKIKSLTPANIYFVLMCCSNILHRLDINHLHLEELNKFIYHITVMKQLPQISRSHTNAVFIKEFMEWYYGNLTLFLQEKKLQEKLLLTPSKKSLSSD